MARILVCIGAPLGLALLLLVIFASALLSLALLLPAPAAAQESGAAACTVEAHGVSPEPRAAIAALTAIEETVEALSGRFGAERVLVVFDIDNTLLTATEDFGSDAWFKWQNALLTREGCDHLRVGDDFGELLEVQYLAYAIGDMRPTEAGTADLIAALVAAGHPVIALTARGPDSRSPTLRELTEAGIAFPTAPICRRATAEDPSLCVRRGTIAPATIATLAEARLSEAQRARLREKGPHAISYGDGVMMVAGQDKGLMLTLLLASVDVEVEGIVFVDDGSKNVIAVERAFPAGAAPEAHAFWYTAFEESNAAFLTDAERLEEAADTWRDIGSTLCWSMGTFCGP